MTVSSESADRTNLAIAAAVNQLREDHGVTVDQLAVYAGLNRASLYKKLKGEFGWKATDITALARYFSVLPGDLFAGVAHTTAAPARPRALRAVDNKKSSGRDTPGFRVLAAA